MQKWTNVKNTVPIQSVEKVYKFSKSEVYCSIYLHDKLKILFLNNKLWGRKYTPNFKI